MDEEPSVESVQQRAAQNGLPLTEDEASQLLAGVKRTREMVRRLRDLVRPELEPASIFAARPPEVRR